MIGSATVDGPGTSYAGTSTRVLETKLYAPRARPGGVARPHLIQRVREGATQKLTLVVAPAGFGKTTLLAAWLAEMPGGAGAAPWVSLDTSESEPPLFWAYVIRALQRRHPAVGAEALALLQSPDGSPLESALTALLNEIDALDTDVVLALDDYHVIDEGSPVHAAVAFLLDHLPPRMHVVIASRAEPPLPLARLRARGELTELRAADLRFTPDEVSAFLNQVMALGLSPSDTATLARRTEGWIAGLKLAALSVRGRGDVRAFVDAFSGDNRYVADYLVAEALSAEPEVVRRFLLGTAMLDRLSGALCDDVTGEPGSQALLESLERRNLFVVPLDDRREWFRYHHLFAEVLQARALRDDPDRLRACHRRASTWYERHGPLDAAVRHAFGAEDFERAATLLELRWPEKNRSYQTARWLEQVKSLPDAVVRARPVLTMGYAWALLNGGALLAAEERLRDVERWLAVSGDVPDEVAGPADDPPRQALASELAAARVYLAQSRGDVAGTVEHAQRTLDLLPDDDHAGRATNTALVALGLWARGELEPAYRTFSDALALMRAGGHPLDAIRGMFVLGDIRVTQGRLRDATAVFERGLRLAAEQGPSAAETDELHLGLSELHREWGDLDAAAHILRTVAASAEQTTHTGNRERWCTAMARVREGRGDLPGAHDMLDEAETHTRPTPLPRARPVAAMRARLWIAQGRLGEATEWARAARLSIEDDLRFGREFEHVNLARLLIARHETSVDGREVQDAIRLLERLATAAEGGGRTASVIEILVVQSVACRAAGDVRGALRCLERALTLAEPEGYVRVFVDEGNTMRALLRHAVARGVGGEYARRVLSAFDAPVRSPVASPVLAEPTPEDGPSAASRQVLTARELEILRLIAAGLRNLEIADQLSISPATVKRHVANAYAKLDARHRTEALLRARALKIL